MGGGIDRNRLVANYSPISNINDQLEMKAYHSDDFRVNTLSDNASLSCNILQHFVEGLCLDLLAPKLCTGIIEVEHNPALLQLANEELRSLCRRCFCQEKSKSEHVFRQDTMYIRRNGGSFSISTCSFTTNRLLRCLRGGLPTMGIVSCGVVRSRLIGLVRGGDTRPPSSPPLDAGDDASGLTTTMGGVACCWLG
jgi:hypothetical protein